ncbi:hypothetical protein P9112_014710 [Eukaryota sp. TZLM1-RC]
MGLFSSFHDNYRKAHDQRTQIVDLFIVFHAVLLLVTLGYGLLINTYPFNSYMSAIFTTLGSLVLTVNLRLQTHPSTKDQFPEITPGASFASYVFAQLLLFFVAFNFMG